MRHEVTIISDDFRFEIGNKVTLAGVYDEAIVFTNLPSRLLKLAFYQRWLDVVDMRTVRIEVRGSAIGDLSLYAEAKPTTETPRHQPHNARITIALGPLDFLNVGTLEFLTFFNDDPSPRHIHQLDIRVDPTLKLLT